MKLATQAFQNMAKIEVLNKERVNLKKTMEEEYSKLCRVRDVKISIIEDEQNTVINELREKAQRAVDEKSEEIRGLTVDVARVKTMLEHFRLDNKDLTIPEESVRPHDDCAFSEDIGYIF